MRLRRRPLRNRRSARLARISAPPQHSVYPAVSQNDNHRCREQQRTAFQKTWWPRVTPSRCRRHIPQNCGGLRTPEHRGACRRSGSGSPKAKPGRGRRRLVVAGSRAPIGAQKPPASRPRAVSTIVEGEFRSRRAGHHLPGSGERGRRRTRQDQISRGGFGPR
jgi:hypothetical protein